MNEPNPYDAPQATLQNVGIQDDSGFLREPREVNAGAAMEWYGAGWASVTAEPGIWIVLFLLFFVAMFVAGIVPFGSNLLAPVLTAGVALGCDAQRRGEPITIESLFAGFSSPHLLQLILLGVLTVVATFVALLVVMPVVFGVVALTGGMQESAGPAVGALFVVLIVAAVLLVMVPLTMATVFSPMLTIFHGIPALEAMLLSLRACTRNVGAVLLWFLLGIGVAILATLPCLLGWFIAFPLFLATNYAAYRDIFYAR